MKKIILGNWKMNKSLSEVFAFCANFKTILSNKKNRELLDKVTVGIAPTYVGLLPFSGTIDKKINVIAQNVSDEVSGARTGQVAAKMLKDLQVKFCLIGHSEVRSYLHETNSMINEKIKLLNINNISPVLCIGETLSQFEKHLTEKVIQTQLDECLLNIDLKKIRDLIIAYEPIWAIGTGKTATNVVVRDSIAFIKTYLKKKFKSKASLIKVLYGGSVNEINAGDILKIEGVDGVLVGGASLDPQKFWTIISSAKH